MPTTNVIAGSEGSGHSMTIEDSQVCGEQADLDLSSIWPDKQIHRALVPLFWCKVRYAAPSSWSSTKSGRRLTDNGKQSSTNARGQQGGPAAAHMTYSAVATTLAALPSQQVQTASLALPA